MSSKNKNKKSNPTLERANEILRHSVIKIKDTDQMYDYIKSVLSSTEDETLFGYYVYKDRELKFFDGHDVTENKNVEKKIKEFLYKKNKTGEIISDTNDEFIYIPIFETSDESEVLVIKSNQTIKKFVEDEFSVVLQNIHIYRQLKLKCEQLVNLTHIDEVTGLFNQRKLTKDLDSTILSHFEKDKSFSLMFVDIDHFKSVNDNYGHVIGSDILRNLGRLLKKLVRSTDDVYRFGGDEFIIIVREVDIKTVHMIGARTLQQIKEHEFKLPEGDVYKMSVSIGIAEYPTDAKTSKEMIQLADKMMYESKKTGRGKVIHLGKEVKDADVSSE